ncbi:type III secretion system cytoplasmic ring protein SctQ [Xanthomonas translucens pv. translucens]|uniref:Type III secretion system conserved component n=3 Tax=Xanthomonas campestris pv. translucens TaxID=343 RepID=A0A1C3TQT6_XANCT|nr:type III secretion system cytoplasmic ring protein SctQ [Xanthomonas translucens]KTF38738.1 type III secretion protein HrcQ [Xanthomonas translucens pv. translucens]CCP41142.1 type III secretion protein SctQ [Xanthomonas translucens pv. translucens DSM 18974]KWV16666.1 type III secretion protein HrcQ [Xanthomonas translucens]MCT8290318.1 type III secretion system cytoplasmic ring protein SctQ [Xanthomonas translucens pv. translucens]MQS42471.1 YscQ/HrcQ family type III secretion apparatus p
MSSPAIAPISQLQTRLPRIARSAVRLGRLLCRQPLADAAALTLQHGLPESRIYARVGVELGSAGRLTLCMDVGADPALRALLVDGGATQTAVAALLLDVPLAALARLGLGQPRVVDFAPWPAPLPSACGPLLVLGDMALPLPCMPVDACAGAMQALETACGNIDPGAPTGAMLRSLRLCAYPCLGERRYRSERLASLRPGDVLIAPLQRRHGGYRAWLRCGVATGRQWRLPGHIERNTFHIEDSADMAQMSDATTAAEPGQSVPPSAPVPVEQVDVPVQLELDPLVLPLAELGTLHPGHVLELNTLLEDACVHLMVYGQSIGNGRLIAIGDHLGVQLVSVNGHPHADA